MLDKTTYKNLFNLYYQALCQYAYSITNDRMESEDMVQDVFVYLWTKRDAIEISSNPKSYLLTSVRNKIYENNRKKTLIIVSNEDDNRLNNVAENNLEVNFDEYLLVDKLYTSIRQLPKRCSAIFALSKIEGKSNKDIADHLGLSIKTVENQMTKAYKLLRESLKDLI